MISPRAPLAGSDFYFWEILASRFLNNILTLKSIDDVCIIWYNVYNKRKGEQEMKTNTINAIKRNAAMGRETVHGAYTYRVAWNEEANEFGIQRARTCDADRQWIDADGNITSEWRWVK